MNAWVVGASGAWGGAVTRELLARGFDAVTLGRTAPTELAPTAAGRVRFVTLDLAGPAPSATATVARVLADGVPHALFVCSSATGAGREALVHANYIATAALIAHVGTAMCVAGRGRIGVFLGQNARLGLAGAGDFSASQAALWTWCEALQAELAAGGRGVTLTRVIPPRTASRTQQWLAAQTGHHPSLHDPDARGLVTAVLAGKRTTGRRPIVAALAMLLR